ncbi:MAG: hypothetical protein II896_07080 [Clostridia bacterium]|nr:hypothetical protein [Clostridia bacterium]
MKKIVIALIAAMLVVVLAFSMFACKDKNSQNNGDQGNNAAEDNGGNGTNDQGGQGSAGTVSGKVGDEHYAAPQASNITTAEVEEVLLPFINKIATLGDRVDEDSSLSAEEDGEIFAIIAEALRQSGVDKDFLARYMTVVDSLWDGGINVAIERIKSGEALWTVLSDVLSEANIQAGMTVLANLLKEVDANKAIAVTTVVFDLIDIDIYSSYNYDFAKVDARLAELGINRADLRSATFAMIDDCLLSDDGYYLATVVMQMLKNVADYSAAEMSTMAKTLLKVLEVGIDNGFKSILTSDKISYREMVSIVNTTGKMLGSMLSAIGNEAEFGKAVKGILTAVGVDIGSFDVLLGHTELLRAVTNLMSAVTVNDVTNIYSYFDDWNKNKDKDTDGVKFVTFVAAAVNFVKGEYAKLSDSAKADLSLALGNADLYKTVDELLPLIPANVDAITASEAKVIGDKLTAIKGMVKLPFGEEEEEEQPAANGYVLSGEVPFVVADASITAERFAALLSSLGFSWRADGNGGKLPRAAIDEVPFTLSFDNGADGKTYAVLSGEGIAPNTKIAVVSRVDGVISAGGLYNAIRVAKGSTADAVQENVKNRLYSYRVYDRATHQSFRFECRDVAVAVANVDFTKVGDTIGTVAITTPYGVVNTVARFVVYDSESPAIESISVNLGNWHVALNSTVADAEINLDVYYDNGRNARVYEGFEVASFDTSKVGNGNMKVSYQGFTDSAHYYVYDPANLREVGIDVSTNVYSLEVGTQWKPEYISVYLIKDDGSRTGINDYTVSGFDSSSEGYRSVKVTYKTFSDSVYFRFMDYSNAVIESIYAGCNNSTISVGDTIESLQLYVWVYYDGNYSSRKITEGFSVEGFDSSTTGFKYVTVTYKGYTDSVYYRVESDE